MTSVKKKQIVVTPKTHQRLLGVGCMGETFDQLLNRLVDEHYELEIMKNNIELGEKELDRISPKDIIYY
jgi:hypothetical protein